MAYIPPIGSLLAEKEPDAFVLISFGTVAGDASLQVIAALVGLVLLFYDHILMFSQEVRYIWTRPFRLGSFLYVLGKYFIILELSFSFSSQVSSTVGRGESRCTSLNIMAAIITAIATIGIDGVLFATAYAVSRGSVLTRTLLFTSFLVLVFEPLIISSWVSNCDIGTELTMKTQRLRAIGIMSNLAAAIVFKLIATIALIVSTWILYLTINKRSKNKWSLSAVFIRRGTLYFLVALAVDVFGMVAIQVFRSTLLNIQVDIGNGLTGALTTRFYLALCQTQDENPDDPITTDLIPQSLLLGSERTISNSVHLATA